MMNISDQEKEVLALIDDDELVQWIQALTQIPSVWRPEKRVGEEAAARWVEARCQEIGLETHFEMVQPGRPNVIALHRSRHVDRAASVPVLMFEGHTDVVTEGDHALWRDPPFSATIRDGRIYGRGANDMKAGLVCALIATKAIVQSGIDLKGDILIGAVCDEEGEMIGIKHFVDQGWADQVDAAIICEPEENTLCICQKGVMWVRVEIEGVMSHGAMPLTGVNSAYPLARFLCAVEAYEAELIERFGSHRDLGQPSITPTIVQSPISGEPQNNVMPGGAAAVLDLRLVPGQNPDEIFGYLQELFQSVLLSNDRLSGKLTQLEVRYPTQTDAQEKIVTVMDAAVSTITGHPAIYGGVPGSTDGTILNARKGIPIVTCGPGDKYIPHHINEWVSIQEIKDAARIYVLAALRFLEVSIEQI